MGRFDKIDENGMQATEVVITGVGVVSPIGIGREAFWDALLAGRCGLGRVSPEIVSGMPPQLFGHVPNFEAKAYVANRKSLKVMSRDAQLGIAASVLACRDAGVADGNVDPERMGVVLGADQICAPLSESQDTYRACCVNGQFDFSRWVSHGMPASYPLGLLRVLPNMIASHVSIAHDAHGPNNTIHEGEISGLLAVIESASVIQRGMADVMLAGGASSQMHPLEFARRFVMGGLTSRHEDPSAAVRPFDARRDGHAWSEGAAVVLLESRSHAEKRGARIHARLKGWSETFEPVDSNRNLSGSGLSRAIAGAMNQASIKAGDLGHVKAHGLSTVRDDTVEARVLASMLPETPVTALKGQLGNAGAAGSVMELAAAVLAAESGCVPALRNYETPDPACPVRAVRGEPLKGRPTNALCLTWMPFGQTAAVVVGP
jgi:3-oxoacyl-[acyl-carrier-protein] synthase II